MNRIKELRKAKGITQNKLCEYLQIAQPTLSGYETNNFEPDFVMAFKIADYFNVSIDYLLGYDETQKKPAGDFPVSLEQFKQGAIDRNLLDKMDNLTPEQLKIVINALNGIVDSFKKN